MKILVIFGIFLSLGSIAHAQDTPDTVPSNQSPVDTIVPKQAKAYMGKEVVVCGRATGRSYKNGMKGQPIIMYAGPPYPNHYLTIYFSQKALRYFIADPDKKMINKRFCLRGKIAKYRGKPAIYVKSRWMLNAED